MDFLWDLLGFVPVIGDLADIAHGLKYLHDGNITDAIFCFASLIPLLGDGAAKLTKYTVKSLDEVGALVKITDVAATHVGRSSDEMLAIARKGIDGGSKTLKELISESDAAKNGEY